MQYTDIKTRFYGKYKGEIRDPILTTLLDTLDKWQYDLQAQSLIGIYAPWSGQFGDGLFETLRRNLFGKFFPGPAFSVAQAYLFESETASPFLVEPFFTCSLQDTEGNKNIFSVHKPTWIFPSFSNEVSVQTDGNDLLLGFSLFLHPTEKQPECLSVYVEGIDPYIIERIRCRIHDLSGAAELPTKEIFSPFRSSAVYPTLLTAMEEFFFTPFDYRFLEIPMNVFSEHSIKDHNGIYWLRLRDLASYALSLQRNLTINALLLWNVVRRECLAHHTSVTLYSLPEVNSFEKHTIITSVQDVGHDYPVEYIENGVAFDSSYPYQYTSQSTSDGRIQLSLTPSPQGDVKVYYSEYDIGSLIEDIAAGRSFGLYQGMEEYVRSVQAITPTHRNIVFADKELIWDFFRSLIASRGRVLSREDIKAAVMSFPPFIAKERTIAAEKISIREKIGRIRGFIAPYTEITIPVFREELLQLPDKLYFQKLLGSYIKKRTINSNYLGIRFVSINEVS
ncbi:MAG TPA: hypothetical protein PLI74_06495 [Candidatus Kapabacteria bacterium]|jgi:hypothetical protein|nr:hypothetical protein [Candidatus Kapabacteria bacterium]